MKLKAKILFTFFILIAVNVFGQQTSNNLKIGAFSYPNPSVSNFLIWLDLSTFEWEAEMKKYEFSDRGLDNGCVFYGSGASLENNVFSISKCPGNLMSVSWTDFSQKGITKLDALINEIEPYYKETIDNGNSVYAFKSGKFAYEFTVHRDNSFEFVFVKKYPLQK